MAAQSGGLVVRVKGPVGPLAGADVEALHTGVLLVRAVTDDNGTASVRPLPGGTYTVTVRLLGYANGRREGIRINAGEIRSVELTLELAPIELEGITVTASRVQIQQETVEFSMKVEEEAVDLLPVSRETGELVALTPGARPDHVWGGASAQANSYRIDGISANNPGEGADLLKPSPLWIAGVDVRGLGSGAEYGGFQGGLVDITTKSGTDRFQGSMRSTLEHDLLTASNLTQWDVGREVVDRSDVEGEVRGPLVQDRLYYYLSGQRTRQTERTLNHLEWVEGRFLPFFQEESGYKAYGKINWTPSSTDRVEVSAAFTDTRADNHDLNGYIGKGAAYRYSSPTWLLSGRAWKIFEGWGRLDAGINHLRQDERSMPYHGGEVPGIIHYTPTPPYAAFGNAPLSLRNRPTNTSANLMGTLRFEVGGQEHSLKLGGEYSRGSFENERIRNGEMSWAPKATEEFDPEDPSTWFSEEEEISTLWGGEVRLDADVSNAALFAQGSIALGSRVTLSPGVRWGRWKGWVNPLSGSRFLAVEDDAWDPRVGISVDLTGHGTLVAKAHWGLYHQSMITQMFDRASGSDAFTNEEFWAYSGDPFSDPAKVFTLAERDSLAALGLFRKRAEAVLTGSGPVQDYRQPYVEEWVVGLEKRIYSSAKFSFLYSQRSNRDMVALVDLNRETNYTPLAWLLVPNDAILRRLRCLADGSCPEAMEIPGMTPADTLGLGWNPEYVLTRAPGAKREFSQFQVSLDLAHPTWGGTLSYVRMLLKGNLDNVSGYTDPTGLGPGPYVRVNEGIDSYGRLGNYSSWEFKASFWGLLRWGIRGGLFWAFRAGDRYSRYFRISAVDEGGGPRSLDPQLIESLEGHMILIGPRGYWRLERQATTNLSLEKSFNFGGRVVSATMDVFNLFRCEAVTEKNALVNHKPVYWTSNLGYKWAGIYTKDRLGSVLSRVPPQTVRLGVVVYF